MIPHFRSKRPSPSAQMHLLGAEVSILPDSIRTCATNERDREIRRRYFPNFARRPPHSGGREQITRETRFLRFSTPGPRWSGYDGPLIRRQYGAHATNLTQILKRNLLWWLNAIFSLPPRLKPIRLNSPVRAHSDAQGLAISLPGHSCLGTLWLRYTSSNGLLI